MSYAYLNVVEDGITIKRRGAGTRRKALYLAKTASEFTKYCEKNGISQLVCSSSLDFPREYTTQEHVVEMANLIRGNNV